VDLVKIKADNLNRYNKVHKKLKRELNLIRNKKVLMENDWTHNKTSGRSILS
jgi:hypothetical protein